MQINFVKYFIDKFRKKLKGNASGSSGMISEEGYDIGTYLQYHAYLKKFHDFLKPEVYVEIGVRNGDSLMYIHADTKAIAIDPMPVNNHNLPKNVHFFCETADDFFVTHNIQKEFGSPIGLAFIDGMHLFDFALRDFINTEKNASRKSVIIIHDTHPVDLISSQRERKQSFWTGDMYKMVLILNKYRPDLKVVNMDCALTGLCLVTNLDPYSRILIDNYSEIVNEYLALSYDEIKPEILNRSLIKVDELSDEIINSWLNN